MEISTTKTDLTFSELEPRLHDITDKLPFSKPFQVESYWRMPNTAGIIVSINQDGKFFVSHSYDMRKRLLQLPKEMNTKKIVHCMYAKLEGLDERLSARNALKVQIKLNQYKQNNSTPVVQ
ncbi:hypothetical protein V6669_06765 [Paenibacillus sp. Y5S-9]|uniref:hypothetical protein n=1 Tax=Paenibacillus sp. Y5S-9 TaxID=3122489 RepID=UPI0030CF622A